MYYLCKAFLPEISDRNLAWRSGTGLARDLVQGPYCTGSCTEIRDLSPRSCQGIPYRDLVQRSCQESSGRDLRRDLALEICQRDLAKGSVVETLSGGLAKRLLLKICPEALRRGLLQRPDAENTEVLLGDPF